MVMPEEAMSSIDTPHISMPSLKSPKLMAEPLGKWATRMPYSFLCEAMPMSLICLAPEKERP